MSTIAIHPSLADRSPIRLTPRGRFLARLAVLASLSILLFSAASIYTQASAGPQTQTLPTPYVKVTVTPGQTLWSIASSMASPGDDPRDLVNAIVDINHLKSPELFAGQKIYLPTRH